jgi:hypothetical protein
MTKMKMHVRHGIAVVGLMVATLVMGCGGAADTGGGKPSSGAAGSKDDGQAGHNVDGWWCGEHGVPEEECSRCSAKAAAKFKAAGDWCDKHGWADSQCFECHPELEAQFAARYEARTGKKPEKPRR